MTAQIFAFSDYRTSPADPDHIEIDLVTAVDVAIRDLRDIERHWGTAAGLKRLRECRELLVRTFTGPATDDRDADTSS